jgi:hypothetical protein
MYDKAFYLIIIDDIELDPDMLPPTIQKQSGRLKNSEFDGSKVVRKLEPLPAISANSRPSQQKKLSKCACS